MKKLACIISVAVSLLALTSTTHAVSSYLTSFTRQYAGTSGTALNACILCHTSSSGGSRNAYGSAYANAGHNFVSIESADSDGDTFTNIAEINARTFPGNASSRPTTPPPPPPPGDTTAPTVSITGPGTGATVSGTVTVSATASDNVGVAGVQFRLDGTNLGTQDATAPYSVSWNTTTATNASHTLTAVARDAAGNTTTSAVVTVTVSNAAPPPPPPADTAPPSVTSFGIPADSTSLTVPITSFVATDNVGVTGVMVRESATRPGASTAGWVASAPSSFSFATAGAKTLHAWAKDAAGNVSVTAAIATVTITAAAPPPSDGAALYAQNCQSCHGALANSSINNRTVSGIQSALRSVGDMSGISLTTAEIQAIVAALAPPPGPGPGPGPAVGMEVWNNTWFSVTVSSQGVTAQGTAAQGRQKTQGYLNIVAWDPNNNIFDADLHQYDQGTGQWSTVTLPLNFASGSPLNLQVSSQVTGNVSYGFTARVKGTAKNGLLSKAKFKTLGGYVVQSPADNDNDEDDESNPGNRSGWLKITGNLVPESTVPVP